MGSTSPLLKHVLTRVLGLGEEVKVFLNPIRPDEGDRIMICSDGLTNYLPESSIRIILEDFSASNERKVEMLIHEANQNGGGDNITVVLLEVVKEGTWDRFRKRFLD